MTEALHVFVDCGSKEQLKGQQEKMKKGGGAQFGLVHFISCRGMFFEKVGGAT